MCPGMCVCVIKIYYYDYLFVWLLVRLFACLIPTIFNVFFVLLQIYFTRTKENKTNQKARKNRIIFITFYVYNIYLIFLFYSRATLYDDDNNDNDNCYKWGLDREERGCVTKKERKEKRKHISFIDKFCV